jgi:hypothetical protein
MGCELDNKRYCLNEVFASKKKTFNLPYFIKINFSDFKKLHVNIWNQGGMHMTASPHYVFIK